MTDTSIFGTEASKQLPSGASNGQIPIWNSSTNRWEAGANGGFDPTANITFSGGVTFTNSVTVEHTNFNLLDVNKTVKFNIANIILDSAVAYFPSNWATNIFAATDLNNNFSVAQTFAQNINASKAIVMAASAGNGYIQMGRQSASPSGVASNLSIFADASNRLSFREGTGSIATFSNTNLGSNAVFSFPNVSSGTLATIDNAQTFTATQTISNINLGLSAGVGGALNLGNGGNGSAIQAAGYQMYQFNSRHRFDGDGTGSAFVGNVYIGANSAASARLHVKGDGTSNIFRCDDNLGVSKFSVSNGGLVSATTFAGSNSACNRYSESTNGAINWAFVNSTTAAVVYQTTGLYSSLTTDVINTCAVFELRSTTKGFLPPRMTTAQRDLIASPVAGLLIYNTTTNAIEIYTTSWAGLSVIGGGGSGLPIT